VAGSIRDELTGLPSLRCVTRSFLPQAREPAIDHVAIDLGAKKSQICVRGADGRILEEKRWPTGELETYLAGRPTSRVIVETCAEASSVADAARKLGHETRVVPATLVKTLGVGARRLKTDQRDARRSSAIVETA
jgi:hypothetical protein